MINKIKKLWWSLHPVKRGVIVIFLVPFVVILLASLL